VRRVFEQDPDGSAEVLNAGMRAGIDPEELAWLIDRESGWNPEARNASGAYGLLQWMPKTRQALDMGEPKTRAEQAPFVEAYFKAIGRRIPKGDAYLATFYPAALGEPDGFVIAEPGSRIWEQNPSLRSPGDGAITAGSVRRAGSPPSSAPVAASPRPGARARAPRASSVPWWLIAGAAWYFSRGKRGKGARLRW
jgi:hypothetical protein